ncbi:hypothetical protein RND81_10G121600 [Saponaria officinalis]|uniref:non-specific serine/threonine protein kinase n=1 Tax=Saponaria officinalis TaxID=3572 RepID=A0AAW1I1K6_SAPOF
MELFLNSAIFVMARMRNMMSLVSNNMFAYANDEKYEECNKPYQCGDVSLSYPFYDAVNRPLYCGYPGFEIQCNNAMVSFIMSSEIYHFVSMDATSHTISVAKQSYWDTSCPQNLFNTSINFSLYKYTSADQNFTLFYDCPNEGMLSENEFSCNNGSSNSTVYYLMTKNLESSKAFDLCQRRVLVPILQSRYESITNASSLISAFRFGFGLEWIAENDLCDGCRVSGGECGYDSKTNKFTCFCPDQPYDSKCGFHSKGSISHKVYEIAGVILACITVGLGMLVVLACYFKRRRYRKSRH